MNPLILSLVMQFSAIHQLDATMVMALIETESQFNTHAVGSKGEIGLMQLMPQNYKYVTKKELMDPATNIALGTAYLAQLRDELCIHKNDNTFLVCYNMGPYKAKKVHFPKLYPYYKKIATRMKHYE